MPTKRILSQEQKDRQAYLKQTKVAKMRAELTPQQLRMMKDKHNAKIMKYCQQVTSKMTPQQLKISKEKLANQRRKLCLQQTKNKNKIDGITHLVGVHVSEMFSPLLLPDFYNSNGCVPAIQYEYNEIGVAKQHFDYLKEEGSYKRTDRKYVTGTYYSNLFPGYAEIDAIKDGFVVINVMFSNGESSIVRIGSAASEHDLLDKIVTCGNNLPSVGNCRNKTGDKGCMQAFGLRDAYAKESKDQHYVDTFNKKHRNNLVNVSAALSTYLKANWKEEYNNIRTAEKSNYNAVDPIPEMGGAEGAGNTLVFSCDLCNSAHIDHNDSSRCVVIWAEKVPGNAENWYLMLPDVSLNGSKGVAIKLHHGAVVSWDGAVIRHCTNKTILTNNNHVYGLYAGSCNASSKQHKSNPRHVLTTSMEYKERSSKLDILALVALLYS